MAWGPPNDRDAVVAVVREAVRCGVNHIDTSDYYGAHIVNQILKEALHPYPAALTIATKVGAPVETQTNRSRKPYRVRN